MFGKIRYYLGGRDSHGLNSDDYIIIKHYASLGQRVNAVRYIQSRVVTKAIVAKRIVDKVLPKDIALLEG